MTRRRNVAFAGSVLPAPFLQARAEELGIGRVFVVTDIHEKSYAYVAQRVAGLEVTRLPAGAIANTLAVLWHVAASRMTGREVVFFHECCWPLFDLAVSWFKPNGRFFPQITMTAFDEIAPHEWPQPSGFQRRLRRRLFAPFLRRFVIYQSRRLSGSAGFDYFLKLRAYPSSIRLHPPTERPATATAGVRSGKPSAIFVTGKESLPDDVQRGLYEQLIAMALEQGYEVFVKDHPLFQLKPWRPGAVVVDAAMPIELIDRTFDISIGVATTALVSVGTRKLSIVHLLDALPDDAKDSRIRFLRSLQGGGAVEFPTSIEDVGIALRETAR